MSERQRVSLHEAAHNVAADELGMRVQSVKLFQEEDGWRGSVHVERTGDRASDRWNAAIVAVAGQMALEMAGTPYRLRELNPSDREQLLALPSDHLLAAQQIARDVLKRRWVECWSLAEELQEHLELERDAS